MGFRSTNHTSVFLSPSFSSSEPRNLIKWVILNLISNFVEEICLSVCLSVSLSNYSPNIIIGWYNFYIRVPTIIFTVYLSQNYTGNDFHIKHYAYCQVLSYKTIYMFVYVFLLPNKILFKPSLVRVTCETSQVLLVCDQLAFVGDLPVSPHLPIELAQNEWNNLDGP